MKSRPALLLALAFLAVTTSSVDAASLPPPVPCDTTQGRCWQPAVEARWQYQLKASAAYASSGGINTRITTTPFTGGVAVVPDVLDFDLFVDRAIAGNNTTLNTAAVKAAHARGAKAICYVSAGSWEEWRADAHRFPKSVLGAPNGWPGERWLDIRRTAILLPIIEARIRKCREAGFDGIEFDNVDGYSNRTGFPLKARDQLAYNVALANLAHRHGLTAALKNGAEQAAVLATYFDYAVVEQCHEYRECDKYAAFTAAGKAVFQVEYRVAAERFCGPANAANRNAILKDLDLSDTPYTPCR